MPVPSIYSRLYVRNSRRAKFTPRVARYWRPRVIAWHGPDPFFRNRFYELDSWYKARIQRPEMLPQLHIIDPDSFFETYEQKIIPKPKEHLVNIGFKLKEPELQKSAEEKDKLELLAISNELLIDLDLCDSNSNNQLSLIDHFKVFDDLFMPGDYFYNTQGLDICWKSHAEADREQKEQIASSSNSQNVYFGNHIKAANAVTPPLVKIGKIGSNGFNTLLMINLEGPGQCQEAEENPSGKSPFGRRADHQTGETAAKSFAPEHQLVKKLERRQLLHWMVPNIADDLPTGSEDHFLVDNGAQNHPFPYLPPVPFMGTGYHRFVFLLFRHPKPIDFSRYSLDREINPLLGRAFNVHSFCKQYEDQMTPSALRFCLIEWDPSCDQTLHSLGMKSPRYWYEWNEPLKPEQKEFPMKAMPFNNYLDMFRNQESVRREIQKERLEMLVKLKTDGPLAPEKYPDIFYKENRRGLPEFMHERLMRRNTGTGIYSSLYDEYENPALQHRMEKYCVKLTGNKLEEWCDERAKREEEGGGEERKMMAKTKTKTEKRATSRK